MDGSVKRLRRSRHFVVPASPGHARRPRLSLRRGAIRTSAGEHADLMQAHGRVHRGEVGTLPHCCYHLPRSITRAAVARDGTRVIHLYFNGNAAAVVASACRTPKFQEHASRCIFAVLTAAALAEMSDLMRAPRAWLVYGACAVPLSPNSLHPLVGNRTKRTQYSRTNSMGVGKGRRQCSSRRETFLFPPERRPSRIRAACRDEHAHNESSCSSQRRTLARDQHEWRRPSAQACLAAAVRLYCGQIRRGCSHGPFRSYTRAARISRRA
jgi:hypothetical protein